MALSTKGQAAAQRATLIRVREDERRKKQDADKLSSVKPASRTGSKAAAEYVSALSEASKSRQVSTSTTRNARQQAIDRATRGALLGEYTITRNPDGVTTITQSTEQKEKALSRILSTLNEKQQQVLDKAVRANSDRVMQTAGGFVEDSLLAKYAKAIQDATDADGNVNLNINSKYTFNPYTDGVPDDQARRAFNSISIADQLQLEIGSNGKPKTPSFGDVNVDTSVYDRYQAALKKVEAEDKQREANAKYTEKQQTAQKKQAAEEQRDASLRAEVESLYQQHRGEWDYDTTAVSKSIAERYGVSKSDVSDIFDDLKARYDYDDAAYQRAFRYKNLTDPTQIAKAAGVSDAALKQTERGVYTPSAEAMAREQAKRDEAAKEAAWQNTPMDAGIDNEQPWEYDSGKAYEAYWAAVDAGDMQAAKAELDGLRDKKAAQMQQLGMDTKYVINQAVQGIGDVVSGLARGAAWLYSGISPYNPGLTMSYDEAQALKAQGIDPFSLEYRRRGDEVLDTLLYISESSGSGPLNEYNTAGADQTSGTAQFLGGLFRSGMSSLTAGAAGATLGAALPGLEKTISLKKITENAPRAVQVISKAVPDVTVGVSSMPFMVQCFSSGYYEARAEGYDENAAEVWGLYSAFAEGLPEAVSWNISATAGSSVKSKIYGGVSAAAAKSGAKNGVKKILGSYGAQKTLNVILTITKAANAEGMEEIASNYLEYAGRKWILQQDAALPTAQENLTSYASGALLSLMGQGFSYATTSKAYKQAKQMLDDAANGNPPSAPQVQELIDACNEEAIKTPLSNAELDRMDAQGLKADEGVVAKYRAANDALSGAERRIATGLEQLSQMNAQGVSPAEPARKQVVDDIVKARAEINGLRAKRDAAHARYVQALDGMAEATEQAMEQTAQQRAQSDAEFGQWQVEELLKTDPAAVASAAAEMETMFAQEIERMRQQLFVDGGRMDTRTREAMMQRMKQLEESVGKLAKLRATANTQSDVRMRQGQEGPIDSLVVAEEAERGEIESILRKIELLRNAKKGIKSKRKLAVLDAQIDALQAQYEAYFTLVGRTEPMEAPRRETQTNDDGAQPTAEPLTIPDDTQATAEPLTIPDETQNGEAGTNTPPEIEAPAQGDIPAARAYTAQQMVDDYRADGATDEQIERMARTMMDSEDAEPDEIELAREILGILGQGNRSIAQRYIESNGSRAKDGRVTDLLNIARQEAANGNAQAADEAGLEAAREILRGTAQPADPSIAAMKEQLRRLGIVPTAEERANIAATYGSYDAYRRAVVGVVPLGGQNKAGQSIDQAIGELADSFPGQVTGDDRVQWLYDFARNNPAGAITYDGDLDANARNLWEQIRGENADYFASTAQQNPGFDVPDFNQPNVKCGKAAARKWLRNVLSASAEENAVLDYARDKSVTALMGKERAFWENVLLHVSASRAQTTADADMPKQAGHPQPMQDVVQTAPVTAEIRSAQEASTQTGEYQSTQEDAARSAEAQSDQGNADPISPQQKASLNPIEEVLGAKQDDRVAKALANIKPGQTASRILAERNARYERDLKQINYGNVRAEVIDKARKGYVFGLREESEMNDDEKTYVRTVRASRQFTTEKSIRTTAMDTDAFALIEDLASEYRDDYRAMRDDLMQMIQTSGNELDGYVKDVVNYAIDKALPVVVEERNIITQFIDEMERMQAEYRREAEAVDRETEAIRRETEAIIRKTEAMRRETEAVRRRTEAMRRETEAMGQSSTPEAIQAEVDRWTRGAEAAVKKTRTAEEDRKKKEDEREFGATSSGENNVASGMKSDTTAQPAKKKTSKSAKLKNKPAVRRAFRQIRDKQLLRETIHLFDGTSPYTQGGMEMQTQPSTARAPRKLTAIKRDIQHIVGFTYSDEHFNGALRRSGEVAYYEPAHNFISSSDTNNITAFLHETGHAVGLVGYDADEVDAFLHTMPQSFIEQYDPAVRAEEAGAEMFRAWMLNPNSMERLYPNTFAGMRQAMGARQYERLKEQGNSVRYFLGDSTEGRINATMYERKDAQNPPARDVLRRTTNTLADKWYGFKKMDRAVSRARGEEVRNGLDAKMGQARISSEAVNALFFDGMYDPTTGQRVGSSLAETMQGVRTREDIDTLNAYLEVMQALDRYDENEKDWVFSRDVCTPAEARAYAERVERTKPNVVESANNLWAWLKTYRDTQLSSAISADAKAEWERRNPHYIPQTRNFMLEIHGNGQRGGANGQGTGVNRRRVGSTRDIVTPVEAIAQMVTRTKTAAMQHEVLVTLQGYYDNDPDGVAGTFLHEIPPEMVPTAVPEDVIRRAATDALRDAGMDDNTVESVDNTLRTALQPTQVFTVRQPNGRGGNAIAITVDGNTRYFEVYDQDLLNALTAATPQQVKGALGAVKRVSRAINSLITSKNPAFALSNAARDFQEAYFTGSEQNPVKFVRDYVMAAADVIHNNNVARQYKAMGGSGGMSTLYADDMTINDLKKAMFGSVGDSRNAMQKALGVVNDAIEDINGGIETIPRLAEYKRQLRRGASYADAIKAAKNCTTDFSTTGSGSGGDMSIWRFYNASVQSTYKMANMVIDGMNTPEGRRRLGKQVGAMLAFGVAGRALAELLLQINDDDGTYEAMPEYIKDSYWVIPTGEKGKYVRIPLPNGALMTTVNALGRRIGMTAMGVKNGDGVLDTLGDQAQGLLFDMLDAIIPFGEFNEGNPLGSNFVLNPAIQVFSNTSWTGAPIVPASMENLSPALQYTDSTSALAKYIGKVLNVSPLKVDYIINQNSGVIGEVKDAVQTGVNKAQTDGAAAGVGAGFKEFFLSRFLVDTAYSEQVTSAYYDQRELLSTFLSDVDETMGRDGLPYSPQLKGLNPQQTQAAYTQAKALDKQLNDLTKQLSALSQMATRAANDGDDEKAREYRFTRQELAAEGSLHIAEFYDRWKQVK